ncbi:MAG TPA: GAF domain-containing sensor histidine kinase [Longilinea sp.]|nr:GAF domain-containing sensor histidine kinase [Longilinea sp.]
MTTNSGIGINTDTLLAISQSLSTAKSLRLALDSILPVLRSFCIFDNIAIYRFTEGQIYPEVIYARATGRGKNAEADAAWGEAIAGQVLAEGKTVIQVPKADPSGNRLNQPYLLATPLSQNANILGILVSVRFGGPVFTDQDIKVFEFIGQQVSWLLLKDIIEQIQENLESQNRAIQLQEEFIHTITHELRSPLGFIKGYTTTLLRDDTSWAESSRKEFLQIIDQEADNLEELIGNLLDSARLQSGQMRMDYQKVRMDVLINDVIQRALLRFPGLDIKTEFNASIPPINGDPRRLAQVFENLLNNAAKYAPGSPVIINISMLPNTMQVQVTDKGPGIPANYLPHLFERFFRNPESLAKHGSGLGLFICKQIIQNHSGEIKVESVVGEGTSFTILLPIAGKPADPELITGKE